MKRLSIPCALCLCLASALPAQEAAPAKEPAFQGRPLSAWIEQLRSSEADERREALAALGQMGKAAEPAVTELVRLLRETKATPVDPKDEVVRSGEEDDELERLIARTFEHEWETGTADPRVWIVEVLARIGPSARGSLPTLLDLLKDPNPVIRRYAGFAAGRMGEPALPGLQAALRSDDSGVRMAAACGLGEARRRLATVPDWAKEPYEKALAVAEAAGARDPAAVLRTVEGLEFEDREYRERIPPAFQTAARQLGEMGGPAVELLGRRIARGDRVAILIAGMSGLTDLTVALERRLAAEEDPDAKARITRALAALKKKDR